MTALRGTSVTLEELAEAISSSIKDARWLHGVDTKPLLAHDFRDPRARLEIECRHSSNRVSLIGSQVTTSTHYAPNHRMWLSDGKILRQLPDRWRQDMRDKLRQEAPDLVESHSLGLTPLGPHDFMVAVQWLSPAYLPDVPRRLGIYGPMAAPEQTTFIADLVRSSIAHEAPSAEEALERTKAKLIAEIQKIAPGQPLPRIDWHDSLHHGVTTRAECYLLGTDLSPHRTTIHCHYRTPLIDRSQIIYSSDEAAIQTHYRYLTISEKQNGMLRLTALAKWLCGRPDGTIQGVHRQFTKTLLGQGTVKIELKAGRFEATFTSPKLKLQTGKVTIDLEHRFPETVIASMKGRPLGDLLQLDGVSEHIIITSLGYEGNKLVGRLRDTSQYFLDGEIIVDKLQESTSCI